LAAHSTSRRTNCGIRDYIAIASSSFDDTVEYPVGEEAVQELENPSLTTEEFHKLYRRLTPVDHAPVKKGRVF
jgi:hypothetical protein